MKAFRYSDTTIPIRADITEANRSTWRRLAKPGAWWSGAERIAIAEETRNARSCGFCVERKSALSPYAVTGKHDGKRAVLQEPAVDAVHRIVTDQSRLSAQYVSELVDAGISDSHYVELLGVVVAVISIDRFHSALGLAPEPLPDPEPGEPSRYRPQGLVDSEAWVPMLDPRQIGPHEADLFEGLPIVPNVFRAMSLVPDAVRSLKEQGKAYYLQPLDVANPRATGNRAISRQQMELIAGRVSALNECFY